MTAELWAAVSAVLLAVAVAAWLAKVFQVRGPWTLVAALARLAAGLGLIVALGLSSMMQGGWSPWNRLQVTVTLTLAMLVVDLVLARKLDPRTTNPFVDLVGLALILVGVRTSPATAPVWDFLQRTIPYYLQWLLFLLGSGAALVAGCAGLMLVLQSLLGARISEQRLSRREEYRLLLKRAAMVVLVAVGAGLTVSVWWAWRSIGTLNSTDPRAGWLAIGWLCAAMSLVAWRLERGWERWAGGLAMVAAVVISLGVLGPWL